MNICIIGAGASGCICAYFLLKKEIDVTIFDIGSPLRTLLPTGGGRCNLAHAEYDFKELAKNYPRGEKFLYSVFSKFSTYDTLALFEELGIETYTQDDGRIFPTSNSSKDVREKILKSIKNAQIIKEGVNVISPLDSGYKVKTNGGEYFFDKVILATGGGKWGKWGKCSNGGKYKFGIDGVEIPCTDLRPSLVGLKSNLTDLSGVVLKDVYSTDCKISGDILFTHFGISGPLIYKISSIKAYDIFPYKLNFDLYPKEFDLQKLLNKNPHKELKNILSTIFPHRFAEHLAGNCAGDKAHTIDGQTRDKIANKIHNFELIITDTDKGEETVTAGGYDLNFINPKTMESKVCKDLYIIGEALDIDGFCGGFNLQNAWSTAFVASDAIINS